MPDLSELNITQQRAAQGLEPLQIANPYSRDGAAELVGHPLSGLLHCDGFAGSVLRVDTQPC